MGEPGLDTVAVVFYTFLIPTIMALVVIIWMKMGKL